MSPLSSESEPKYCYDVPMLLRSAFWFLLPVVGVLGCSDMLGLGDLSYPASTDAGTGGSPSGVGGTDAVKTDGGDGDVVGDGPDPESPLPEDYPAIGWAPDSLLVSASPAGADTRYYRYAKSEHRLSTYRFDSEGPDLVAEQEWGAPGGPTFTHVVALRDEENEEVLIGYDGVKGFKQVVRNVGVAEPLRIETDVVNEGYSHFVAGGYGGEWFLVAYDTLSGQLSWVPALSNPADLSVPVTNGSENVGSGWTAVTPFSFQDQSGVLLFRPEPAEMVFFRFPDDYAPGMGGAGAGSPDLRREVAFDLSLVSLSSAPTTLDVVTSGNENLLFFYDQRSGDVEVWRLGKNETGWVLSRDADYATATNGQAGKIRRDLSSWAFFPWGDGVGAITFDGEAGAERFFGPGAGLDIIIR